MAKSASDIYRAHPEAYDEETAQLLRDQHSPLDYPGQHVVQNTHESQAIARAQPPYIIVASNGMLTGGRSVGHAESLISDPSATILFVGYQGEGTLGGHLVRGVDRARINGKDLPVRATVRSLDGFSAHADEPELLAWLGGFIRGRRPGDPGVPREGVPGPRRPAGAGRARAQGDGARPAGRDPRLAPDRGPLALAQFDLPLAELERYRPERHEPAGFDAFWARTLAEARAHPIDAEFTPVDARLPLVQAFDVTYRGFGGQPVRAWLLLPASLPRPLPVVVKYAGYGGGRGLVQDHLLWPAAGYAHLVMDTRGQGSTWAPGDTPDVEPEGVGGPQHPGFLTRGIGSPITGTTVGCTRTRSGRSRRRGRIPRSTGRGSWSPAPPRAAGWRSPSRRSCPGSPRPSIDVPFLCHVRRAIEIVDTLPYDELTRYLSIHRAEVDAALATVEHADGLHFAARGKTPSLWSVGLRDEITPPSTVFAAYNHYAGPKEIRVLPYSGHDAGALQHVNDQLAFLAGLGLPEA